MNRPPTALLSWAMPAFVLWAAALPATQAVASPSIAFAFSAKPEWYWSFWRGETPEAYRKKMIDTLLPLTASPGNVVTVVTFEDAGIPDQIDRDRAPWPFHQHLCRLGGADWLVSLRVADNRPVFSSWQGDVFSNREVPSAHWPELYWVAYDCKTGERATGRPILSPRREDRFVFETELTSHAQAILQKILASHP